MSVLDREAAGAVRWSRAERVRALKQIVSPASITKVLRRAGRRGGHCRRLPRWFVVWFVIAMGLFSRDSYRQVFRWLQRYQKQGTPGRSTLCEARQAIGPAPLRALAHEVIQLQGTPNMPGAFYQGLRIMAVDSFVVDVPDTPANARTFGRPKNGRAAGAFPQVRVLSLCEAATHIIWRSLIKPHRRGEVPMADYLLGFLEKTMLVLWDRNFLCFRLVRRVIERGAHVLGRAKTGVIFTPLQRFQDQSYLAKIYPSPHHRQHDRDGLLVRIIEYTFQDPGRPGSGQRHRLLTTLLDPVEHPANTLIVLYHERWEEEITFDEIKTHQRERPVLRSETPAGVVQEIYGLLLGHYVIRKLMCDAAELADCAPRELSFVNTLKTLRCRLAEVPRRAAGLRKWYQNLIEEVAAERLEPRRDRVQPRVIKRKMKPWDKKREKHRNYPQPTQPFHTSIVLLN
jgi:Insertion element 4 transposase N-terminal/Transposase DDE domain